MYKILIVEDELQLQAFLKRNLSKYYEVVGATSSGEEAISMASKNSPDIVLMDINIEGNLDGIETAKQIQDKHDVAVLFLTSRKDDDALHRTRFIKPFGYIVKPVDINFLKSNIAICVQMYKELSKKKQPEHSTFKPAYEDINLKDINSEVSDNVEPVSMQWKNKNRIEIGNDSHLKQYWVLDND